jgi:hypothetical protein
MLLSSTVRLYWTDTDRTFFQSFDVNPNNILNRNPFNSFCVTCASRNTHELKHTRALRSAFIFCTPYKNKTDHVAHSAMRQERNGGYYYRTLL